MFRILWKMKVEVGERDHDVVQEYTELNFKIGYALRERMMWKERMVMKIYREKNPC